MSQIDGFDNEGGDIVKFRGLFSLPVSCPTLSPSPPTPGPKSETRLSDRFAAPVERGAKTGEVGHLDFGPGVGGEGDGVGSGLRDKRRLGDHHGLSTSQCVSSQGFTVHYRLAVEIQE